MLSRFGGSVARAAVSQRRALKPSTTQTASTRAYATINHDESYIIQDFRSDARPLSCRLRKHEADSGRSYARAARAAGVIPGVINRGTDSPCFIEMDPRQIVSYMERHQSRFMGRRYRIKVEDTGAEYEVVPHQLDVVPTNLRPLAVTFSLFDKKSIVPARVPRHVQRIMYEGVGARYDSFGRRRSKAQRRKELADAEK